MGGVEADQVHSDPASYELAPEIAERVTFNADGLVPAIVQDKATGDVLMMAWMDEHALAYSIATRQGTYWSRSRKEYWIKGLTSGHTQYVHDIRLDCDGDTILLTIDQTGAACHRGTWTCFDGGSVL